MIDFAADPNDIAANSIDGAAEILEECRARCSGTMYGFRFLVLKTRWTRERDCGIVKASGRISVATRRTLNTAVAALRLSA